MKIFQQYKRNFNLSGLLLGAALFINPSITTGQITNGLQLHYQFNQSPSNGLVIDNAGANYFGTLKNGATIIEIDDLKVLDLGSDNGYLDLGSQTGSLINSLSDFTIATYLYIANETDLSTPGNFIWAFGNSDNIASTANGCMFLTALSTRYAISPTNWRKEQKVTMASAFEKGQWKHIVYKQTGTVGAIYIDGSLVKSGTISISPKSLGATSHNYLGKSSYRGDEYLKNALYADFRIYDRALSDVEINTIRAETTQLISAYTAFKLNAIVDDFKLDGLSHVIKNLTLPGTTDDGVTIEWSSSNENTLSNTGIVTRPINGQPAISLTLTATFALEEVTINKAFDVTVPPLLTDDATVLKDAADIFINGNLSNLRSDISLPTAGINGSAISWSSNQPDYLSNTGIFQRLAPVASGKQKVILTASITKGSSTISKTFDVFIAEDEGTSAYLFAYFTGNSGSQEAIRFALSNDGYTYKAMNNNNPVINSSSISLTGGVRDPHIYRGPDNNFYMVVTDMVSANGWSSNRGMVLLKSDNLTDWTSSTVHIPSVFPSQFGDVLRVWAPQTIYDADAGKFMIYFSMLQPDGYDIIYYAYTNDSFTALESVPKQLFYSPTNNACIDGDIIQHNGLFHLFFKTEGNGNGIKKATSAKLTEGYVLHDAYLDQSDNGVEGSGVFKMINSDKHILMYDVYTAGHYEFTESTDLLNFSVIQNDVSMNFEPRHGTVMAITEAEAIAIANKWANSDDLDVLSVEGSQIKRTNLVIDNDNNKLYIPVRYGTDITSYNPEIKSIPGASISPSGDTDFSKGNITYTISSTNAGSRTYEVTVSVDNNPTLEGYYADPEILYSNKTGKFYLYPTSDGFVGWSGTYFKTFSSSNLVDWKDEGIILDLKKDVSWASKNAWAPTIIERKIDGKYKYFYYFSAAQKIGVAVADDPTGPFIDSGSALLKDLPSGATGGQQIDPDVFHDPVSGKYFLYWGNGYAAVAELNDDMISINSSTEKLITPESTYREGTELFYRNGKYYFLWSADDTRSENYHVRYATGDSPTGPFTVPGSNLVISKDVSQGIYGTGHNSVIQVPGKDEWYIVYHRFTRPAGITMGDAAGYFREVCIDKLTFGVDGSIIPVTPSLKGISPVSFTPNNIKKVPEFKPLCIYPNPAKDKICVRWTDASKGNGKFCIFDYAGKKLMQIPQSDTETCIDTSSLKPSVYFLTLSFGNSSVGSNQFVIL